MSLARGLAVVGTSPALLASVFLGTLALWLTYSSSGVIRVASPGVMGQLDSVPPVHSLLDIQFLLQATRVFTAAGTVGVGVALLLVRTALMAFWLSMILSGFQEGGDWRATLRSAGRRTLDRYVVMLEVEAGFVVLVYVFSLVLGSFLGLIGLLGVVIVTMIFLIDVPIAVVAERVGVREAVRLSLRAARLPGRQHIMLSSTYVFLTIFLISATVAGPASPATPSILVWAYVLFLSAVHVSILAAFTYRWLVVKGTVFEEIATGALRRPILRP